ncbi:MAG: hypothetical protein NVS9B2_23360 [Steroidobacteraceae bacterium]
MAQHLTQAQIQTVLAKTGSNMKPYEIFALADALMRLKYTQDTDGNSGAAEAILGTTFASANPNP